MPVLLTYRLALFSVCLLGVDLYTTFGMASNNKLYDAYVKFFRWAVDRLQGRDGIICYVSNNSFIEQFAFDGMRKHMLKDFTHIYHLDLHGNVRKNPKLSGTTHNAFGIQVGVGITIAIRISKDTQRTLYYHRVPENWTRQEKLSFLTNHKSIVSIEWQNLQPDDRHTWLTEGMHDEFASFLPLGSKETKDAKAPNVESIFKLYSLGVATNRDEWVYDFSGASLIEKMQVFFQNYNSEVFRLSQMAVSLGNKEEFVSFIDNFVNNNPKFLKWTDRLKDALVKKQLIKLELDKVRNSLYRPYCKQYLYFDNLLNQRRYQQHLIFPTATIENTIIWLKVGSEWPMFALATNVIPDLLPQGGSQCFPYYTYAEDGSNRRENITDWALAQFKGQYGEHVTKWDIFHYVYAMLHHPAYRERYAENLKRDLPRIPLLSQREVFTTCVRIGKALMELHLKYETEKEYNLKWIENKDVSIDWRVEKMKLSSGKDSLKVNEWLTLAGIPQECFQYRLGNRSALEWVIDQYQVSTDARSGIVSDPNQEDDEQYIVRLVGKVVTVSVETVKLVEELAQAVKQEDWLPENEVVNEPSQTTEATL